MEYSYFMKDLMKGDKAREVRKNFVIPINPSEIFDWLFNSNLKYLINSENNFEMDNIIDTILDESLAGKLESKKVKKLFEIYSNYIAIIVELLITLN